MEETYGSGEELEAGVQVEVLGLEKVSPGGFAGEDDDRCLREEKEEIAAASA